MNVCFLAGKIHTHNHGAYSQNTLLAIVGEKQLRCRCMDTFCLLILLENGKRRRKKQNEIIVSYDAVENFVYAQM